MACEACKKRAEARVAQMKAQAEKLAKLKEQGKSLNDWPRPDLIKSDVEYKSVNSDYFEAKAKLYWWL